MQSDSLCDIIYLYQMNRFKFRVWRKEADYYPAITESMDYFSYFTTDGLSVVKDGTPLEDDDYVIQQCTGFTDLGEREIYEGDIVEWPEDSSFGKRIIKWSSMGAWMAVPTDYSDIQDFMDSNGFDESALAMVYDQVRVIGNIFETYI